MPKRSALVSWLFVGALSPLASGQYLMVAESGNPSTSSDDRVVLVSAADGSIVNANFITDANNAATYDFEFVKDVIQVGNEIWVSDQTRDRVYRFTASLTPTFIAAIGPTGLDNIRGMEVVGNTVYVANAGTNNSAPGTAIVTISTAGAVTGSFDTTFSPFDLLAFQGDLLVSDIDTDDIARFTTAGAPLGPFWDAPPTSVPAIDFPQQLTLDAAGNILAAGFSTTFFAPNPTERGVYRFSPSGAQLNFWETPLGINGVHELGNGKILVTLNSVLAGGGLQILNPATGVLEATLRDGVIMHYINPLDLAAPCPVDLSGNDLFDADDIFAFLNLWFAAGPGSPCVTPPTGCPGDWNNDGTITADDIFAFLNDWFASGPGNPCP